MKVSEWAKREGYHMQTVYRWLRNGTMPVPFEQLETGTYVIHDPKYEAQPTPNLQGKTACYARVSSSDQKEDLVRQMDRLKAYARNLGCADPICVSEVGSGMNGSRRKLNKLLADASITRIIVEHRDRFARMNMELVESALAASGREVIVVDDSELDDDLVRDMTEVLVSFCARLYGRRSARDRARRGLEAMERG